jgi:hypothetical protein
MSEQDLSETSQQPETPPAEAPTQEPTRRRTWSTRVVVAASILALVLGAGAGAAFGAWSRGDPSHRRGPGGVPAGFGREHRWFPGQPPGMQPGVQPGQAPSGVPPHDRDETGEPDAQGD